MNSLKTFSVQVGNWFLGPFSNWFLGPFSWETFLLLAVLAALLGHCGNLQRRLDKSTAELQETLHVSRLRNEAGAEHFASLVEARREIQRLQVALALAKRDEAVNQPQQFWQGLMDLVTGVPTPDEAWTHQTFSHTEPVEPVEPVGR